MTTAKGSPSGTATTIIVIPTIKYSNHHSKYIPRLCSQSKPNSPDPYSKKNLKNKTATVIAAEIIPSIPISLAIASNFI